jgi:hypothetical protein
MIHYHGTPCGGKLAVSQIFGGATLIRPKHFYGERATCRTVYEVVCDGCGAAHSEPDLIVDGSVFNAQQSGWHIATRFPGESYMDMKASCPSCRAKAR